MTNVNLIYSLVQFITNKNQSGQTMTPSEFNNNAFSAVMTAYEQDYDVWVKTRGKELSQYLQTYLKKKVPLSVVNGVGNMPTDYQHTASVRHYYNNGSGAKLIGVDSVANVDWGDIQISSLNQPTERFPKYTEYATFYEFLPRTLNIVYLDYFSTPIPAQWNYEIIDDTEVYDPLTSIDFQFNSFAMNRIISLILRLVGINLSDEQLQKFAQEFYAINTQQ